MTKKKRSIISTLIIAIVVLASCTYYYIRSITSTSFNIDQTVYIYIDNNKNYEDILTQLDTTAHIQNLKNFEQLAEIMNYKEKIKTGRYKIIPKTDIKVLLKDLISGNQSPIRLKFNNIRLKDNLAERLAEQLMLSKTDILNALNDSSICAKYNLNNQNIISMFIPNTYEVYWDTNLEDLLERMNREYQIFWNEERKEKAKEIGLSPVEVSTLASILEEECYYSDEYPMVAGLYLNRLREDQLLQADPTVKFAVGDFSLQRILFKHLETESPYNTYIHTGLPPGPIRIPSIKAIDAVLNPTEHSYFYMCAKEDFSGRHRFAKTHAEHQRNANLYRNALNKRKIFK